MIKITLKGETRKTKTFQNKKDVFKFLDEVLQDGAKIVDDEESAGRTSFKLDNQWTKITQAEFHKEDIDFSEHVNTRWGSELNMLFGHANKILFNRCTVKNLNASKMRGAIKAKIYGEYNTFKDCNFRYHVLKHDDSLRENIFDECGIDCNNNDYSKGKLGGEKFTGCTFKHLSRGNLPLKFSGGLEDITFDSPYLSIEVVGSCKNLNGRLSGIDITNGNLINSVLEATKFDIGLSNNPNYKIVKCIIKTYFLYLSVDAVVDSSIIFDDHRDGRRDKNIGFQFNNPRGGNAIRFTNSKINITKNIDGINYTYFGIDHGNILKNIIDSSEYKISETDEEKIKTDFLRRNGIKKLRPILGDLSIHEMIDSSKIVVDLLAFLGIQDRYLDD